MISFSIYIFSFYFSRAERCVCFRKISLRMVSRMENFVNDTRILVPCDRDMKDASIRIFASHNFTRHFPDRGAESTPSILNGEREGRLPAFYVGRHKMRYRTFLPLPLISLPTYLRWKCLQTRNRVSYGQLGVVTRDSRCTMLDGILHIVIINRRLNHAITAFKISIVCVWVCAVR